MTDRTLPQAMPLIDIGANLGHESFDHDLDNVIARARAVGIVHMLVTGTSLSSTEKALTIANAYPDFLSLTSGYHPHEALACTPEHFTRITELARLRNVCAVGETGLDFNRDFSPRPVQEDVFLQHLQLACEIDKPVFLHQRDAHTRFFPMLRSCRDDLQAGGVVHCFTGEKHELYDYLDLDMYIGITGWACDERRGSHLLELLHDIPADRLLLETDAPYLLPRTLRPRPKSRRNEPAYLTEVVRVLALTTGRSVIDISHQTTENARRLFKLSEQEFPGLQLVKRPTQLDL